MTRYEKAIYDLINGSQSHLTAAQVFVLLRQSYPGVVPATVYNNLNKLCAAGLIRRISVEGMPDRYDAVRRHDHLVCRRCGCISDVELEDLSESLRRQLGEAFESYDLKVFGLCGGCMEREKSPETAKNKHTN